MRVPLHAFYLQDDFPPNTQTPVFAAVVPYETDAGRGYRIYKDAPGVFSGTWQKVVLEDDMWTCVGEELSLGEATWTEDKDLWSCADEPPDIAEHVQAMDQLDSET